MDEPFRQFEWPVAAAYHWQHWLDARGRRIGIPTDGLNGLDSPSAVEHTWGQLYEEGKKTGPVIGFAPNARIARKYSPMSREHATLFRTFAELDYTNLDAIATFVGTYGLLGLPVQEQDLMVHQFGKSRFHAARGESHIDWAREICLMREALHQTRSRTSREEEEDRAAWGRVGRQPPHAERRKKLGWLFDLHLQHVQARMILNPDAPPRLSFAPLTLLAAMWLQLALSVAGDKEFRACKLCRRLFEISTEQTGYRRHREFCSESCKTKDYRKRKRTAVALAKQGKDIAAISDATRTDKATVRSWTRALKGAARGRA
ncbi:MAG: hypothetical protein ACRD26_16020 [Vicinamibacterales bacterium]